MGESDRYLEYKHLRKKRLLLGNDNNALVALVAVNASFFLFLMTLKVSFFYGQQTESDFNRSILQWFTLPSSLTTFSERPWTILTYLFSDTWSGLMRLISNMLWLWAFGSLMQQQFGNDKLFPVYLYGGWAGAIGFWVAQMLTPEATSPLIGANAAVLAVAVATTALNPDYRILTHIRKGIPVWVLLTVFILFDFAGIVGHNTPIYFNHLGGALAGWLFVVLYRKGYDGSLWMVKGWNGFMNMFTPSTVGPQKSDKERLFYNTGQVPPITKSPNSLQQRIDAILDKINENGFESLTDEEKEILKKAAEE